MLRKVLTLIVFLLIASPVYGGTISRPVKAGGGTDYSTGDTITAALMNSDFNTIYTEFNGKIDETNFDAAIVFDPANVDDYSVSDAEQATATSPGTSDSTSKATTLEVELANLRYKIEQLTVGTSASAVASGGGTAALVSWIDGPLRGGNLIYHGGFDAINTLAVGTDGDGWVAVLTPTTLEAVALTESEGQGDGDALRIIDTGAALAGVSQTLDGLKADTRYLAIVSTYDVTGTCRLVTTGADTNQLSVTSDDSASWQVLAGTFETDSTPANVVIQLLAVAQSDECYFDNVGVFEINTDPVPYGGVVIATDTTTDTATGWTDDVPTALAGFTVTVTPPMPGCVVEVDAIIAGNYPTGGDVDAACDIAENTTNKTRQRDLIDKADIGSHTWNLHYVNSAPVAGTALAYTVECEDTLGSSSQDVTYYCDAASGESTCQIWAKMTCPTR
jgi:hypothetical protein